MKRGLTPAHLVSSRRGRGDIFLIIYSISGGLFLLIVPWTKWWEMNIFLYLIPPLRIVFLNNFFRGAASTLGLLLLALGIIEIMRLYYPFKL